MKLISKVLGVLVLMIVGFLNVSLLIDDTEKNINLESLLKTSSANEEDPTMWIYEAKDNHTVTKVDYAWNPDPNNDGVYDDGCTERTTTVSYESNCIGSGNVYCNWAESQVISEEKECV